MLFRSATILLLLALNTFAQTPLGSAITYQGQLKQNGSPPNGSFNMTFKLWNDASLSAPANQVGPTVNQLVSVANGLFAVQLDFGASAFNGDKRWLEIIVSGTTLAPRTELTATPYARFSTAPWATNGSNISNTNSANVGIGTASPAQKLSVTGTIESTSGGFKFPDGSTQSTAATGALNTINTVVVWGASFDGELSAPLEPFTAIDAGYYHCLAIRPDGTLAGWGVNDDGQTNVPAGTFTKVSGGYAHSLGIRTDGTLAGWGYNSDGQINVPAGTFTAVSAGTYHSLGIRTNGTLAGWGYNGEGQINVPSGTFIAIATGYGHSLAIRSDGTLVGWGYNSDGQINVPPGTFIAVAAGDTHSLAIRTDGTLAGWGDNGSGQINVPPGTYMAVQAGVRHSVALRTDGVAVAWGENDFGQTSTPGTPCVAIGAGENFSMAIMPVHKLEGGIVAGPGTVQGSLSVEGQASIQGRLLIGADATMVGRLGVGTPSPTCKLEVNGGITAKGGAPGSYASDNTGYSFGGNPPTGMYSLGSQLNYYVSGVERLRINTNGNVGIGTTAPALKLHIEGGSDTGLAGGGYLQIGTAFSNISIDDNEIMARSNGSVTGLFLNHEGGNVLISALGTGNVGIGTSNPVQRLHVIGNICATGSIGACSDRRFKTNIEPLGNALSLVEKLLPVRFDWRRNEFPDQHFTDQHQIGFIAQDVAEVVPEAVMKGSDGYLSIDYGRLTPVLVEAIKQLKSERDDQAAEQKRLNDRLLTENSELRARLEQVEKQVNKLSHGDSSR